MKITSMIFRSRNCFKFFFLLLALSFAEFSIPQAFSQTLTHIKGKAYRISDKGNSPIARNDSVEDSQIIIDAHSQIQVSWKNSNFLEIIGPARFQIQGQELLIEYGRFLFVNLDSSFPKRVHVFKTSFRPSSQSILEIEISPRRLHSQILVFQGSSEILGETLTPQNLYLFEHSRIQKGLASSEFSQKRLKEYSFSQIYINDFSEKVANHSWRNQLIGSINLHLASQTKTPKQNIKSTFGFATRVEWNHKRYLDFPLRPQRIHYHNAPAWRMGAGLSFQNTSLANDSLSTPDKLTLIGPHFSTGLSWMGLSAEGLILYSLKKEASITSISDTNFSFRIRHEWDLQDITLADLMISVGYEFSPTHFKTAQFKNEVTRHGVEVSLHFNF